MKWARAVNKVIRMEQPLLMKQAYAEEARVFSVQLLSLTIPNLARKTAKSDVKQRAEEEDHVGETDGHIEGTTRTGNLTHRQY